MSLSKTHAQVLHAIRRAQERYNLTLTTKDYKWLCRSIRDPSKYPEVKVVFVRRESNRVTIFDLVFSKETLRAVYDSSRGTIVTFLPKNDKIG